MVAEKDLFKVERDICLANKAPRLAIEIRFFFELTKISLETW
jgi:hypothetical protein